MDFDLPDFDTKTAAAQGYELQLTDPLTDDPTSRTITVLGIDSDVYRNEIMEMQRRWAKSIGRKGNVKRTPEEIEADALQLLVAATIGWSGITDKDGNEVPFTKAAALELYKQFPIIREQVDKAIGDRANFLPVPSKSYEPTPYTSSN